MKIAIIDKYPLLRSGLKYFLKKHYAKAIVVESRSVSSFKEESLGQEDLIIIGISQSAQDDNLELIREVKRLYPMVKFIGFDENPEPSMVVAYIKAGIRGYLTKQTDISQLQECIAQVLEGKIYMSQEIMEVIMEAESNLIERREKRANLSRLTAHEYKIARYLSEGMKTGEIAGVLNRKPSTVSTIKSKIFFKLRVDNVIKLRDELDQIEMRDIK
ncbi:response regulator transcription factor [Dyadobacter diqingensis]|uniref:response regulator transcription factor n=1 Tax=Dyadobacter diqingensis TaxID=2938121 RepID=UPI0020C35453|nr:response regulator transcription factor [Dyadobacter diqingensis]